MSAISFFVYHSKVSYVVEQWRNELAKINEKAGQSLAASDQYVRESVSRSIRRLENRAVSS